MQINIKSLAETIVFKKKVQQLHNMELDIIWFNEVQKIYETLIFT